MQLTLGHSLGVWYCGVTPFSKINSTLTFNNYNIIKNDRQELVLWWVANAQNNRYLDPESKSHNRP